MAIYIYSDKKENAAELVSFAKSAGRASVVLTTAHQAEEMSRLGADKVLALDGVPSVEYGAKAVAAYLAAQQPELLLVGTTVRGRDVAARLAGYLGAAMSSDVNSVTPDGDGFVIERMSYGGRVVSQERLPAGSVITIGKGRFPLSAGDSPVEHLAVTADARVAVREKTPIVKEGVDLSAAKRILSVGMGLAREEDLAMVRETAAAMDAEVSCSRGVAEERRWLPLTRFVGISGNIISPDLYLAAGISGQIQHVFGAKESKIIVGINNNEKAPIFRAADYGIVGDLYEILPLLRQQLEQKKK